MSVEIGDWNDLDNVRNDLTGDYVLVNDLDSETAGYEGIGDDWNPIGEQAFDGEFYEGIFEGDGFEIRDLIVDTTDRNVGLFSGIRSPGEIRNLSVVGDITTTSEDFNASVLCSENRGLIENCTAGGSVTALSIQNTGVLVGNNLDTITESYATGSVEGDGRVGGLVGNNNGTVTESYATGSVEGGEEVGGLVGGNFDAVTESYATGSVEGDSEVGGLVGGNFDTVTDSYWDTETSGQSSSDGGTGLTTAEMQSSEAETNMDGFDFSDVWSTVEAVETETIDGQIMLDEVAAETATVILHNFSEPESIVTALEDGYPILLSVDEGEQLDSQNVESEEQGNIARTETDTDGNYSADIPGTTDDTIAVGVDFDDGTDRYGRLITTVLE